MIRDPDLHTHPDFLVDLARPVHALDDLFAINPPSLALEVAGARASIDPLHIVTQLLCGLRDSVYCPIVSHASY